MGGEGCSLFPSTVKHFLIPMTKEGILQQRLVFLSICCASSYSGRSKLSFPLVSWTVGEGGKGSCACWPSGWCRCEG